MSHSGEPTEEPATLSHDAARRFYDDFGARQDAQQFYEAPVLTRLIEQIDPSEAHRVVEFGCGTGRFAEDLLRYHLAPDCAYLGLDISATMVDLARQRVAAFGKRAEIRQTDGAPGIDAEAAVFDRFISTYVLDLLSADDIRGVLGEAARLLRPGGMLAVAGLTPGGSGAAWLVSGAWRLVHRLRPATVGGCRPQELEPFLDPEIWDVVHRSVLAPWAIASEVVVARRR